MLGYNAIETIQNIKMLLCKIVLNFNMHNQRQPTLYYKSTQNTSICCRLLLLFWDVAHEEDEEEEDVVEDEGEVHEHQGQPNQRNFVCLWGGATYFSCIVWNGVFVVISGIQTRKKFPIGHSR